MGHTDRENTDPMSEFLTNLKDEFKLLFCVPRRKKRYRHQTRRSDTDEDARSSTREHSPERSSHQTPDDTALQPDDDQGFEQTRETERREAALHEEHRKPSCTTRKPTAASTLASGPPSRSQGTGLTESFYQDNGRGVSKPLRMSSLNNRPAAQEHGGPETELRPPIPPKHGLLDGSEHAESSTSYRYQRMSFDIRHDDEQTQHQERHAKSPVDSRDAYAASFNVPATLIHHHVSEDGPLEYGYDLNRTQEPEISSDAHVGQSDPMGGAWRDFPAVQGPLPIYSDANDIYTEQYLNMEQELQRKDKELQWALRCHEKERNSYQGRIEGLERALRAEERQGRQLERRPKLKRDRALAEQKSRITTLEAQNSKYKGEISRIIQAEKSLQRDYDHKANENGILDRRLQKALHEAGLRNEEIQNLRSILQSTQVDLERTRKHVQDVQRDIQQVKLAYDQEIRLGTQRQEEHSDKIKALEKRHLEDTSTSAIQHAAEMEILKEENTKQLSQAKTDHDERTKDLSNKLALKELRIAAFSSSGNYKPIHDNGFGQALQRLSQQVKNLTAYVPTTNLIPVDSNIDPTKYLVRNPNSSRGWQNFVRSVCWKIIIRGFFAYQLGFGSLGSHGEGFQSLLMFYQLFARSGRNNANSKSLVFPTNKETNFGRAWFFDGILQSVRSNASGDGFASMFQKNVSYVAIELANALQRLNNGSLVPQAEMQIQNLMREFGELALQMGSQRAQVFLEVCGHGDVISAGERFTEEAEAKGMVEVDLMIQPGLVRIGDGREDLSSEAVIAKGSIVSLKGVSNQ